MKIILFLMEGVVGATGLYLLIKYLGGYAHPEVYEDPRGYLTIVGFLLIIPITILAESFAGTAKKG